MCCYKGKATGKFWFNGYLKRKVSGQQNESINRSLRRIDIGDAIFMLIAMKIRYNKNEDTHKKHMTTDDPNIHGST